MTLQITLSPEVEASLREQAEAAGTDIATFALQALEEKLEAERERQPKLTAEQRAKEWRAWVKSHQPAGHFVDDSRDSIYEGRGE